MPSVFSKWRGKSLLQEATVHVKPSADTSSNKLPDIRGVEQQVQSRQKRTIYRFSQVNTSSCSKLGHRGFNYFQLVRTCRQSRTQHYVCKESDLPSSFQVTCALPVEFGISSISSQRMTAVYPWCVGGCQPLSSPGILQTGQTCGCCFARSFSVFGCRQYAEHSQPVPTPRFSTEGAHPNTPTLGTLAENGSGEQFEDEKQKGGVEEKRGLVQIL